MSRTFYSLRFFNYRMWFMTALVANTGTWMQRVAQDWLILTVLTDNDGFAVGVVTALQFLPLLVLTPFAGVLADRYDKRKILFFTQSSMGLLAVGLGLLVLTGNATVGHVYVFALLLGTAAAFDTPPRQVFVSELVGVEHLPNAVALNSASFNLARLVGPALSGVLIAAVGTGWVFIINGVSFGATLLGLAMMRAGEFYPSPRSKGPRKGQIREAVKYVRLRTDIVVILVIIGVVSALGLNFQLTSATMASEVFHKEAGEYGLLGSIMAIGSLTGALMAARRNQVRVRLVVGAAFGFGVAAGINSLMPNYWTFAISCIFVGYFTLTMLTAANTAIQTSVESEMRGRVMSLYQVVLQGSTPIGAPIVGWISQNLSPRWGIGIGAIASIVVALGAALWVWRHWEIELEYHRKSSPRFIILGPAEHEARAEARAARREQAAMTEVTAEQAALGSGTVAVPPTTTTPEVP